MKNKPTVAILSALLSLVAAMPAAWAQEAPPDTFIWRWTVASEGLTLTIFDATSPDPNVNNIAAIERHIHLSGDRVTVTVLLSNPNWTVVTDPNQGESNQEAFVRFTARGDFANIPPEAPPITETDPNFFGATDDAGFRPAVGANPPVALVRVSFLVPLINGKNQKRLRGIIDYDARWFITFAGASSKTPEIRDGFDGCSQTTIRCATVPMKAIENPRFAAPNPPPFADAGADRVVGQGTTVVLDASRSFEGANIGFDPNDNRNIFDKDILNFTWEWISGPVRVDPNQAKITDPRGRVTLTTLGTYTYRVTVTDTFNQPPDQDSVQITVVPPGDPRITPNRPPRAVIIGPGAAIAQNALVTLDGRASTDPDGDTLSYFWAQTDQLGGELPPDVLRTDFQPLNGVQSNQLKFQAVNPGTSYFRLVVSDGQLTAAARFTIVVNPAATEQLDTTDVTERGTDDGAGTPAAETPAAAPTPAAPLCGAGAFPLAAVPLALMLLRRRR